MTQLELPEDTTAITSAWFDQAYQDLRGGLEDAEASSEPADFLKLMERWNTLKGLAEGEHSRRSYLYTKDMRDEAAEEAERYFREEVVPVVEDHDSALIGALLDSKHKLAVAERFGEQLLAVLEIETGPLAPVNAELRVQASTLAKDYDKLVASGEVQVGAETMTLALARSKHSSSDGALRKSSFDAYYGWFAGQRDAIAEVFDKQVKLRDRMGKNLGHENFVQLGYEGMGRTDYGQAEVRAFRDAVKAHASPLFAKKCAAKATAHGTPTMRPWDLGYDPSMALPDDVAEPILGEGDGQLDKMGRALARLSPKLAGHFERMRAENLIDLENRKGKGAGAYCTSFPDEERVAIFCNSTGDESDLRTLTHELGHAFQGWESQWIDSVALRWPTSDACEVHSMGMEFLSMPYLDEFMAADQLTTFRKKRWGGAVDILCYVSVVDHFQHWIYENPDATADARDQQWIELHEHYMPGIDWSGEAERLAATRWYAQLHIFRYPFYYIDYALAETGAMQLGLLDATDHEDCMQRYMELCRLGGTKSVTALFDGAGLRSPFEDATMRDLMAHAAGELGL